jgi:membrane-associated phospholipid phosphatase
LRLHEMLQRSIERVFFRGKSTRSSVYLAYAIGNVILMLLLFYILLNRIAYDWTGSLYPVGSGFLTKAVAILSFVITVGVILSTLFLKQHYVADEIAGIVLAWGVGAPTFRHFWGPLEQPSQRT